MSVLASLPQRILYAIFAFPMAAALTFGALYLAYAVIVCDPLYADDPQAAGYDKTGPAMSALKKIMPQDFQGDKTMPVPIANFGVACKAVR